MAQMVVEIADSEGFKNAAKHIAQSLETLQQPTRFKIGNLIVQVGPDTAITDIETHLREMTVKRNFRIRDTELPDREYID